MSYSHVVHHLICVLTLLTWANANDLPAPKVVGNHELSFYRFIKNFSLASAACKKRDSRLVEIATKEINDAVMGELGHFGTFWTGGNFLGSNTDWTWNNGSTIASQSKTHWASKTPDPGLSKKCVGVNKDGWKNMDCTTTLNYICEQVRVHNVTVSSTSIEVKGSGPFQVTCTAQGLPIPGVNWYKGDVIVPNEAGTVYQIVIAGSATLHLQHANISASGIYRCYAMNSLLVGGVVEHNEYITVEVPGIPAIVSINRVPCSSSLDVNWSPNPRAIGFEHRISVKNSSWESIIATETPLSGSSVLTTLNGSSASTNYTIEVKACKTDSCNESFNISRSVVTRGVPNAVSSALMEMNKGNTNCSVHWSPPASASKIDNYKVDMKSHLIKVRGDHTTPEIDEATVPSNDPTLTFEMPPNRKYEVTVRAENCAGLSQAVDAAGVCTSSVAAPTNLDAPSLSPVKMEDGGRSSEDETWSLTIATPDEKNGLMSCLFVIVKEGSDDDQVENTFAKSDLRRASDRIGSDIYIAIAIQVHRFLSEDQPHTYNLGSGERSSCNIFEVNDPGATKRRSKEAEEAETYNGENLQLKDGKEYSVFTVSATPTDDDDVLLQKSATKPITHQDSAGSAGQSWVAPFVAVFVVILPLAIIFLIVLIKRRNEGKTSFISLLRTGLASRQNATELNNAVVVYVHSNAQDLPQTDLETEIEMTELEEIYNSMRQNDYLLFQEQFQAIFQDSSANLPSTAFASHPARKKKNRYENILPFDHSRVVISGDEQGYINANYIHGFSRQRKFIASQGPLPGTLGDFWLMVVEQKCGVIVMLTKVVEAEKVKCEKYWPDNGQTEQYGHVTVESREEVHYSSYVRRLFHTRVEIEGRDDSVAVITHYHFMKWPDHGVPPTTSNLIRMHRAVTQSQMNEPGNSPMIVHCSAGVGRTGTFIGYDILLEECKKRNKVDVCKCITEMRKQRVQMVQSCEQFILLHKLILEEYLFGDTDLESQEVEKSLTNIDGSINSALLASEFGNLQRIGPLNNATSHGDIRMIRNKDVLPYEYCLVKISKLDGDRETPYINASWVESYDESGPMIAAEGPLEASIEYFWRAVLDNDVTTIVMLTKTNEDNKEECAQYWPPVVGESLNFGIVTITNKQELTDGPIVERKFGVTGASKKATVTQFQYVDWERNASPNDVSDVIDLIDKMRISSRNSNNGVSLIHCSDGAGRTGTFCAIVNLIERLKLEKRVDVFRAVKDLRDGRPGMVQTLEQYAFCYKAVVDYLKSFELHSNC